MKISDVILVPIRTGFFFDDQKAIKSGLKNDGFSYLGDPVTPGFRDIRVAGEGVSIILILEDGTRACGDCCAVQYSGAAGRDPLFLPEKFIPRIREEIVPVLIGMEADAFRKNAEHFRSSGKMHTAVAYGLSQALLSAAAAVHRETITETVAREYALPLINEPVRIFAQSGDERYTNADKMIIKEVDVMPHGLINNIPDKLGLKGEKLLEYVRWLNRRVCELRKDPSYAPELHIDVYGNLGPVFGNDTDKITDYFAALEKAAAPLSLRIEGPVDMDGRDAQISIFRELREKVDCRGIGVEIVADEWCNTLEDIRLFAEAEAGHMLQIKTPDLGGIENTIDAVLFCRKHGIKAYQGGTCNETDRSARICTQAALATRPYQILAKPGLGFDEGYMIVYNECQRTLALMGDRTENG